MCDPGEKSMDIKKPMDMMQHTAWEVEQIQANMKELANIPGLQGQLELIQGMMKTAVKAVDSQVIDMVSKQIII